MTAKPIISLLLVLAACSERPAPRAEDRVAVVAGPVAAAPVVREAAPPTAPTPAIGNGQQQPQLLTVAESAKIQTAEMWSEPIEAAN